MYYMCGLFRHSGYAHDAVIVRMNLANKCGPLWIVVAMAFVMLMHGYDIHLHVMYYNNINKSFSQVKPMFY